MIINIHLFFLVFLFKIRVKIYFLDNKIKKVAINFIILSNKSIVIKTKTEYLIFLIKINLVQSKFFSKNIKKLELSILVYIEFLYDSMRKRGIRNRRTLY